ncbi:MAG: hypothetical protein FWC57_03565 [Endomicrobia bacterium]|nr:hypothetical protein [Endomicrobiia bacterium]
MESSEKSKKKWVIFGIVIAIIAVLAAGVPYIIGRMNRPMKAELMIKVKGTIKQASDSTIYLAGDNDLYYILVGEREGELAKNIDKKTTVFGNIMASDKEAKIDGNPVRMKIGVVDYSMPEIVENNKQEDSKAAAAENKKADVSKAKTAAPNKSTTKK